MYAKTDKNISRVMNIFTKRNGQTEGRLADCYRYIPVLIGLGDKKFGYNINVLQQTECLVVNPITVPFAHQWVSPQDSMTVLT